MAPDCRARGAVARPVSTCYLYHANNRDGNQVDSLPGEHRDRDAARQFFALAIDLGRVWPEQMTIDGDASYPRAIRETTGEDVEHRRTRYPSNRPGSARFVVGAC